MLSQANRTCPLVSVIVPTLNRPAMLRDALASIAAQTYSSIEIIIVNDGGIDVESVVSRFSPQHRIVYLKHATNKGLAAARNTGLRVASGDYIAYLDDDDVYYPDHIETLVTFLLASGSKVAYTDAYQADQRKLSTFWRNALTINEECSRKTTFLYSSSRVVPRRCLRFLYPILTSQIAPLNHPFVELNRTEVDLFTRGGRAYLIVKRTIPFSHDFDRQTILIRNLMPVLCVMHHRSCLDRTGLFDETLTTHEDWDLWIRMSQEHDFRHIRKPTCEYSRRTDGSSMTTAIRADFKRTMEIIYERYSYLARNPTIHEAQKACLQAIERELGDA